MRKYKIVKYNTALSMLVQCFSLPPYQSVVSLITKMPFFKFVITVDCNRCRKVPTKQNLSRPFFFRLLCTKIDFGNLKRRTRLSVHV